MKSILGNPRKLAMMGRMRSPRSTSGGIGLLGPRSVPDLTCASKFLILNFVLSCLSSSEGSGDDYQGNTSTGN